MKYTPDTTFVISKMDFWYVDAYNWEVVYKEGKQYSCKFIIKMSKETDFRKEIIYKILNRGIKVKGKDNQLDYIDCKLDYLYLSEDLLFNIVFKY
jgi:hypothetical protein